MPAPPPESEPAMMRIRAVDVTLLAFDPLFAAKFSMCTATSLGPQLPRKSSRSGGLHSLANIVDEALDQLRIVAFGHDPDKRLGAGFANDEPPAPLELGFGGGDALPDAVGLERLGTAVEAHILQQLRKRLELAQKLA